MTSLPTSDPKVTLSPLRLEDAGDFVSLLGEDHEAVDQTSHLPWPLTREGAKRWIKTRLQGEARLYRLLHEDEPIGMVGFGGDDEQAEIGYWMGANHRNQGWATAAVGACVRQAKRDGWKSLRATVRPDNQASIRVLEKNGFVAGGDAYEWHPARGENRQVMLYVLDLKGEAEQHA